MVCRASAKGWRHAGTTIGSGLSVGAGAAACTAGEGFDPGVFARARNAEPVSGAAESERVLVCRLIHETPIHLASAKRSGSHRSTGVPLAKWGWPWWIGASFDAWKCGRVAGVPIARACASSEGETRDPSLHGGCGESPGFMGLQAGVGEAPRQAERFRRTRGGIPEWIGPMAEAGVGFQTVWTDGQVAQRSRRTARRRRG